MSDLDQAILEYVEAHADVKVLASEDTERLRRAIARQFGFPADRLWWWECLPQGAVSSTYAENDIQDWRARVLEMLPADDRLLWLFVTDDNMPPWTCVSGTRDALMEMILNLQYFEYFVVDQTHTWILFDTHHNVLLAFGEGRAPVVK